MDSRSTAIASPSDLVELLVKSAPVRQLLDRLEGREPLPVIGGVTGSLFSLLALVLSRRLSRPLLFLVPGEEEADGVAQDLALFGGDSTGGAVLRSGRDGFRDRARLMGDLAGPESPHWVCTSVRAAVDPLPSAESVRASRVPLAVGGRLDRDDLRRRLQQAGFRHESVVEEAGSFSVRGDLVDFFPHDQELPLRVEFLEERVEGLRRFDPGSQLSVATLKEAFPTLLCPDELPEAGTLAEHLPPGVLVLSRDQAVLEEALEKHLARYQGSERERRLEAWEEIRRLPDVMTTRFKTPPATGLNLGGQVVAPEGSGFESALRTLERISRGKSATLVCFNSPAEKERFLRILPEEGGKLAAPERWLLRPLIWAVGRIHQGFHSPFLGVAAVGHDELFAVAVKRRPRLEEVPVQSRALDSFLDLSEGTYVVHLAHGIARFQGLERLEKGGATQDHLALEFKDGVRLLVPASKIDLVQKYVGGRGEAPELSRLGGTSWARRKEAVAAGVSDLAAELLELQAIRNRRPGIAHAPDSPWQQEFEAAFPFELTPDQARAVEVIKAEMEKARPMDRLICGDVGYGKTEVAMRAAFKCVMGGCQVAVLVPTTVLAQQHWDTFRERMKDYPVTVECLSRFRTEREQQQVLQGARSGTVDILIGTHRLLQGDVTLANLGLLVIDEEQRFGVAHKEKLRRLRQNVDVLVMTATPIPRTLHQALLGIRDIVSLGQAPLGRREVKTEVVTYEDGLVRTAILRELDREGQVFFVHNRVQTIDRVARRLAELVPEARTLVVHGQLPERALERAMLAFLERKADVLVATTIVESGLDIPTANTLFVDDADMYGLADLHQLRGRVGRYHHQAYAYFLVRPERVISEVAEKRLRAIEEFTRLGSGFQIAMRDMEIRGAGNILGSEQSGHIAAVGYDMYCRLLQMAVKGLRHEAVVAPEEVEINLDFTAFLPEGYIADRRLRIEFYRKLGRAMTEDDFQLVVAEMRDRFGPLPPVAQEFVLIARIRALMEARRVARLELMPGEGIALRSRNLQALANQVNLPAARLRLLQGHTLLIVHPQPFRGPAELLQLLGTAFTAAASPPGGRAPAPRV